MSMSRVKEFTSHLLRTNIPACLCLAIALVGCNKKCQVPPSQPFTTLTATDWRLIETNAPKLTNKVDNFNTEILSFKTNFEGDLKSLSTNNESAPIDVFTYKVPSSGMLRITFSQAPPTAQQGQGATGTTGTGTSQAPIDYNYELSNSLTMTEVATGYTYHYVPFTGIVNPDDNCTF
jgi:hypothetical protein